MAAYIDWARLFASAGLMAITYSNVDPLDDVRTLIQHITTHAESLGPDTDRMAIWSCSGNTATALAVAQENENIKCAVFCYGYLIDTAGHNETPGLNVSLDRFIAAAIEENLPITVVNQFAGPHAFDITDDSKDSRHAIYQILDFVRLRLGG